MASLIIAFFITITGMFNDAMPYPCTGVQQTAHVIERVTGQDLTVYEDCSVSVG